MNVSLDTLDYIEERLNKINKNTSDSSQEMLTSIVRAQGFLAGNQFEKAQKTTINCIDVTSKTSNNLKNAIDYIEYIKRILEQYHECEYTGDCKRQ